jgi:hypothetical protein
MGEIWKKDHYCFFFTGWRNQILDNIRYSTKERFINFMKHNPEAGTTGATEIPGLLPGNSTGNV